MCSAVDWKSESRETTVYGNNGFRCSHWGWNPDSCTETNTKTPGLLSFYLFIFLAVYRTDRFFNAMLITWSRFRVFLARSADLLDCSYAAAVLFDKHCSTLWPFAELHVLLHFLQRQKNKSGQLTVTENYYQAAFRKLLLGRDGTWRPKYGVQK